MVEGKDSAAYAIPFFAGTVTGVLLLEHCISRIGIIVPILFISIVLIFIFLVASLRTRYWACVLATLFLSGWFCALSHGTVEGLGGGGDFVTEAAGRAVTKLKGLIAGLPFENRDCNALATALITGDRAMLSREITESFRISGASHLLALSGMHLGIIYLILSKPFGLLGMTRAALAGRFIAIVSATLFYTLMTGASASTVRAFLFICLNEAALLMGRRRKALSALCFALTVQCAVTPEVIRTASFLLSYLAVCGIIFLYPKMRDLFPYNRGSPGIHTVMRKIWDSASLTISCQIFTGPLAWILFRSAPVYFLIANLIAVPLTTLAIQLVLVLLVLEAIGWLPGPAVVAVEAVMQALISSIEIIGGL